MHKQTKPILSKVWSLCNPLWNNTTLEAVANELCLEEQTFEENV